MTMRLQAEIAADGSKAKSELVAVRKATDDLTGALGRVTKEGAQADAALDVMGAEARHAKTVLDAAASAAHQTAIAAQGVSQSHTLAAGSVANLAANFNDVAMMMAAGQNPFMLAIQQITQVLGPMRARCGASFGGLRS